VIFPQPIESTYAPALSIDTLRAWTRTTAEEFAEDELLELGLGALLYVEAKSRVIPQQRQYTAKFCEFYDYDIPLFPFTSIESIKYFDTNNAEQTLDTADYTVRSYSQHSNRLMYTATTLPTVYDRWGAVTVTFNAGYTADNIPANVKQAVRHTVMHWYNNPDDPKRESPSLADAIIRTFAIDVFA
jgi:uncharacterized phiE125 gp8 family phage protein